MLFPGSAFWLCSPQNHRAKTSKRSWNTPRHLVVMNNGWCSLLSATLSRFDSWEPLLGPARLTAWLECAKIHSTAKHIAHVFWHVWWVICSTLHTQRETGANQAETILLERGFRVRRRSQFPQCSQCHLVDKLVEKVSIPATNISDMRDIKPLIQK